MAAALLVVVIWAATGPVFGYSEPWQLVINTGTTIITFLMGFAILHSTNRESKAILVKLDELVRVEEAADDAIVGIEQEDVEVVKAKQDQERSRAKGSK